MTRDEAVNYLTLNKPSSGYPGLCEAIDMAIAALRAPAVTGEASVRADTWGQAMRLAANVGNNVWRTQGELAVVRAITQALMDQCSPDAAAPPAVTGEAHQPLMVRAAHDRDTRPWRYYQFDAATLQKMCEHLADKLAAFEAKKHQDSLQFAAPPAAGAPPALVALVQEWQEAERGFKAAVGPLGGMPDAAITNRAVEAKQRLLAWSPAPAPVAPPAETNEHEYQLIAAAVGQRGKTDCSTPLFVQVQNIIEQWDASSRACHGCGYSLVRCYDCKRGGAVACCPDCDHSERSTEPAPVAVAGGDAPECPNCGGMGTTFHDILVGGTEHDTEERDCEACRGTGRRRQEGQ